MIDVRPSAPTNSPQPAGEKRLFLIGKKPTVLIPLRSVELNERPFLLSSKKKKKMSSKSLILVAVSCRVISCYMRFMRLILTYFF